MLYLAPLIAFPILLLFRPRLAFLALALAIVLMYINRTTPSGRGRRRHNDDEDSSYSATPMKEWKDPWRTGKS